MNVLSLFDGMSCGQQALDRNGIKVDNYFASEIDKYAITVTMANYPNTKQLGSVVDVDGYSLPKIDLLIGGSPCQSFSFAGKRKGMATKDEQEILTLDHYLQLKSEGFEFEGQSYLFWEYMRLMYECKPKYFLLENVMMGEKWEKILSRAIGVNPIMINSSLLSAQNRQRLYWTNIGLEPAGLFGYPQSTIEQPKDKGILLKDVLESEVDEKYFLSEKMINGFLAHNKRHIEEKNQTGFNWKPTEGNKKAACLRANAALAATDNSVIVHNTMPRSSTTNAVEIKNAVCLTEVRTEYAKRIRRETGTNPKRAKEIQERKDGKTGAILTSSTIENTIKHNSKIRRLTPIECERLQTVKDNYTNHVSDSQRYKMLGNGWTVDVIRHILNYMKI
jgi:DNA (cytosine-5)-methyltransferase 1